MEKSSPSAFFPEPGPVVGSGGEGARHRELKRLACEWARARRLKLVATEVRLPRSGYRADVAAATPRVLSAGAFTAVFECKATRADFQRDSAPEAGVEAHIARLSERLRSLRALIGAHRPDLRRGDELFPEFEAIDLRGLRHETHQRLTRELRVAQNRYAAGTKFARLARWRSASLLYLVVEEGIVSSVEVPDGWGLLVRCGMELRLAQPPCLNPTTPDERVALLERIAAVAYPRAIPR